MSLAATIYNVVSCQIVHVRVILKLFGWLLCLTVKPWVTTWCNHTVRARITAH